MDDCRHLKLVLVSPDTDKVRCRRCNLTIRRSELEGEWCPECLEVRGERHADLESVPPEETPGAHYRCESCGAYIQEGADEGEGA
jgi:ribosomal protein S27E